MKRKEGNYTEKYKFNQRSGLNKKTRMDKMNERFLAKGVFFIGIFLLCILMLEKPTLAEKWNIC